MYRQGRASALMCAVGLLLIGAGCAGDAPKHWQQLEQCLIGGPLAKDENVFNKLRGIQLAESLASKGEAKDWPNRCANYATQLHASLPDSGKPGMIKRALREQLGCDGDAGCTFPQAGHVLPAADKLWEAVARAELATVEGSDAPKPKAPLNSLSAADWPVLSSAPLIDSQWSTQGELRLLLKGTKGLSWCRLKGSRAKCAPVEGAPKFHSQAPLNFARDTDDPIIAGSLFSEDAGLTRVGFSLSSRQQVALFGEDGHEAFDGVAFIQQAQPEETRPSPDTPPPAVRFDLRRLERGASRARASLELSARVRGPLVVEDWLVYVERDADQKPVFRAKQLGTEGKLFGEGSVEHAGEFPGAFQVCRAKPGAAIGSYVAPVRRPGQAQGKSRLTVTILEGRNWHAPVGFDMPKQVSEFSDFRCGAGWGGLSWLEQTERHLKLTELVCRNDGCKTQQVSWSQPDLQHALTLGYLHEKALLVYQSTAGDIRTRLATPAELPKAQSSLAFESQDFGGVELGKPRLYSGDIGYLVLEQGGLRVLTFDAQGTPRPVQL